MISALAAKDRQRLFGSGSNPKSIVSARYARTIAYLSGFFKCNARGTAGDAGKNNDLSRRLWLLSILFAGVSMVKNPGRNVPYQEGPCCKTVCAVHWGIFRLSLDFGA